MAHRSDGYHQAYPEYGSIPAAPEPDPVPPQPDDPWAHRAAHMRCISCMWFNPKIITTGNGEVGRCRKHAPTQADGWPVVFTSDWCGDHKIDETKV